MNFFEKCIYALSGEMTRPTILGWFHVLAIFLIVLATILVSCFFKNSSDKTYRKILTVGWIIMAVLEVYKQLVFAFKYEDGVAKWEYPWYIFPYQLCSTPLYCLPVVAFLKDGKVRQAFSAFLSTYSLFAGIGVICYPGTVFVETIGINVQTMVHHGLQVVLGVFIAVKNRENFNLSYFIKGFFVFIGLLIIAIALNEIMYAVLDGKESFNMFYVARHFKSVLPILSEFNPHANFVYVIYVLAYVFGFTVCAFAVFYAVVFIRKLVNKYNNKP